MIFIKKLFLSSTYYLKKTGFLLIQFHFFYRFEKIKYAWKKTKEAWRWFIFANTKFQEFLAAVADETFAIGEILMQLPKKADGVNPIIPHKDDPYFPILLVHGYLHNSSGWIRMIEFLKNKGYKNIYTIDLGNTFRRIEAHSEKVAAQITEIYRMTGKKTIIIGHSMGGLIALDVSTQIESHIAGVITISSPLWGSILCSLGIGTAAYQMRMNSRFIKGLHERLANASTSLDIRSIGSTGDFVIIPNWSTVGISRAKKHVIEKIGHSGILLEKETHEVAERWIREMNEEIKRDLK